MADDKEPSSEEPTTAKTVLIVEDDRDIGEFMVQALRLETSYHPLLASDGFQALKVVREIKPELLLLDYHLPSMDGLELWLMRTLCGAWIKRWRGCASIAEINSPPHVLCLSSEACSFLASICG